MNLILERKIDLSEERLFNYNYQMSKFDKEVTQYIYQISFKKPALLGKKFKDSFTYHKSKNIIETIEKEEAIRLEFFYIRFTRKIL